MGTTREAFTARRKATVQLGATTTSARVSLAVGAATADQVRVVSTADVRVEFGDATVTAATPGANGATPGSMLIKGGSAEVVTVPANTTHMAAICDTGSATVEASPGQGL